MLICQGCGLTSDQEPTVVQRCCRVACADCHVRGLFFLDGARTGQPDEIVAENKLWAEVAGLQAERESLRFDVRRLTDENHRLRPPHVEIGQRLSTLEQLVLSNHRLRVEVAGYVKATALLNAGMESVCESRDELKQQARNADAEVARFRQLVWNAAEWRADRLRKMARQDDAAEMHFYRQLAYAVIEFAHDFVAGNVATEPYCVTYYEGGV